MVRLRHLLRLIREENPDRLLVLSPIPSFQLVHPEPVDTALDAVLTRLPLTYSGGVEEEAALHAAAREIALETGWTFVDNVPALREASTTTKLYNTYDYHIEPVASEIIGRNEARAVAPWLAANARAARRTTTPTP